ncbi:MAG: MGMT family protein [Acidobacteriota bacterium]
MDSDNPSHKKKTPNPFQERVIKIVRAVPKGRVLTYGEVSLLAGVPRGARQVGRILYRLYPTGRVPWQRVINRYGGLSTYKIGTGHLQHQLLVSEGIRFRRDGTVNLDKYRWRPAEKTIRKFALPDEIAYQINSRLPFSR